MLPHEQPTDDVIEDDNELDRWWNNFWNEKKRELAKAANKKTPQSGGQASFAHIPSFKG